MDLNSEIEDEQPALVPNIRHECRNRLPKRIVKLGTRYKDIYRGV